MTLQLIMPYTNIYAKLDFIVILLVCHIIGTLLVVILQLMNNTFKFNELFNVSVRCFITLTIPMILVVLMFRLLLL